MVVVARTMLVRTCVRVQGWQASDEEILVGATWTTASDACTIDCCLAIPTASTDANQPRKLKA